MKRLVLLVVLVVFAAVGYRTVDFLYVPVNTDLRDANPDEIFDIEPGEGFNRIAQRLVKQGIIKDYFNFKLLAHATGHTKSMRVGEYALGAGMLPSEVLDVLSSGKSIGRPLTIQEGFNMYQIGALLESRGLGKKADFIELCKEPAFIKELLGKSVPTLEGYLFPETYMITKYTDHKELIRSMVNNFKNAWKEISGNPKVSMEPHRAVILASIIEKETGAPEERPLISSVFHNRLKKKMRLASDPTIIYGVLDRTGVLIKNIRRKDLNEKTRYNTYRISGLPHGPIANPGKEALRATLNPEKSPYLYFVSKNDGTHKFSTNLKDHNKAVREYQLNKKARQGKSWRDLKKRKK